MFFSGPGLYYKVLLSLEFRFWFGKALFRIWVFNAFCSHDRLFCKGNLKMQDIARFSLQYTMMNLAGIFARAIWRCCFFQVFAGLFCTFKRIPRMFWFWGKTILPERPAQELGLCKVFLQVELAHAGVCRDFCKDDARRAWT